MKTGVVIGIICGVNAEINLAEKLAGFNFQDCVAEVSKQTACLFSLDQLWAFSDFRKLLEYREFQRNP